MAQYWLHAQFHLTATVQEPFSGGAEQTFRVKTVKIDNSKLLELLGAATTKDFTGADLVVDHAGLGFFVVKGTNVLADVSSMTPGSTALYAMWYSLHLTKKLSGGGPVSYEPKQNAPPAVR